MRKAEARRTSSMSKATRKATLEVVRDHVPSRRKRKIRRVRFNVQVAAATRDFDPLFDRSRSSLSGRLSFYILVALLFHAGLFFGLTRFGDADPSSLAVRRPEKVTVRMVEPEPAPPEPAPAPPPEAIEPSPVFERPVATEPVAPRKPVKRAARRTKPLPEAALPDVPADPVNVTPEAPSDAPRRRVVGLSFESTVKSGNGPAFAVGNTRMGTTGKVAEDGAKVSPLAGRAYRPGSKTPNGNRVSAAIPTAGISLVKPKRLARTEPTYPKVLKAQGIEGNVAVLIRIDRSGRVEHVKVVKGSGYAAFDAAAEAAAIKERFSPALRGDEPIEYTLRYTYRFRVKTQ